MPEPAPPLRLFPFRYKLTLLVSGVIVLVLLAILVVMQRGVEAEFRALVVHQLAQADRAVAEEMEERYQHLFRSAVAAAGERLVLEVLTDAGLSRLTRDDIVADEVLPDLVEVDLLAIFDADGGLLAQGSRLGDPAGEVTRAVAQAAWFPELLRGRDAAGFVRVAGGFTQAVGMPVFIGEAMAGSVVLGRQLALEHLVRIQVATGADVAILDERGVALSTLAAWADEPERRERTLAALGGWLAAHGGDAPASGAGAALQAELPEERFLLRLARDPEGFVPPFVVVQSLDRRLAFLDELEASTLLVGGIGIAFGVALAFGMALAVSRPIRSLRLAIHEVERENLVHRVAIRTRDEFSELGRAFNHMIEELAEKQRIRAAFDKSVSRDVADHILRAEAKLGGERRRASILFSDLRDFTTLAERMDPEALIGLVNAYFTRIDGCIRANHGTTDKFIGDAVMALFGIPVPRAQHALDAVRAAQQMLDALAEFNREVAVRFGCRLEAGIGINTGDVVAGLVGSEDRLAYTAVGDDVNLASRLEGLGKLYAARVVLGDATLRELEREAPDALSGLLLRELDRVRVKGKRQAVRIHELLLLPPGAGEASRELERFAQARRHLLAGEFESACKQLETLLAAWPDDAGARALLGRCEAYARDPRLFQRDYSDGVRVLSEK